MKLLRYIILGLAGLSLLISLPLVGFAALGFMGILADVSVAENREFGLGFLYMGLPFLVGGGVLFFIGFVLLRSEKRNGGTT